MVPDHLDSDEARGQIKVHTVFHPYHELIHIDYEILQPDLLKKEQIIQVSTYNH